MGLLVFSSAHASLRLKPSLVTRYARVTVELLEMPIAQCTRTFPFFSFWPAVERSTHVSPTVVVSSRIDVSALPMKSLEEESSAASASRACGSSTTLIWR